MDRTLTRGTTEAGQAKLRRREALLAKANVEALPQSVPEAANGDEHAVAHRARAKLKPVPGPPAPLQPNDHVRDGIFHRCCSSSAGGFRSECRERRAWTRCSARTNEHLELEAFGVRERR